MTWPLAIVALIVVARYFSPRFLRRPDSNPAEVLNK
jgi:hypothetical protein